MQNIFEHYPGKAREHSLATAKIDITKTSAHYLPVLSTIFTGIWFIICTHHLVRVVLVRVVVQGVNPSGSRERGTKEGDKEEKGHHGCHASDKWKTVLIPRTEGLILYPQNGRYVVKTSSFYALFV